MAPRETLMSIRRVVVCEAQVPFIRGGAEYQVRSLVAALRDRGLDTELVSVPFKWYPTDELLAHAAAWRLLDLSESNGRPIDRVIATKFPTYCVRHPDKVAWLMHQYRAAYELCGTPYSEFTHSEAHVGLRDTIVRLDRTTLGECRRVFTNARNTANRLEKYNGVAATALYPPSPYTGRLQPGPYGDYVLSVGRVETIKRPDLPVRAMQSVDSGVRLVVAGSGSALADTERLAESLGVSGRVDFLGEVDDERLLELYRGAMAIVYTPFDEDFGYVTVEAFLSKKPVITVTDSGGPLEFVEDGVNGHVCEPVPEAIGAAINRLASARARLPELGSNGHERVRSITWDAVIDSLLA